MVLKLYNTLTRSVDEVKPLHSNEVRMYNCGPTVYDYAHIGNLRSFIINDVLRRAFEYTGYKVKQVMNITDIDDKMISRANEEGVSIHALGLEYENFLFADLRVLNVLTPHKIPHATAHIGGMAVMVEKLLREGFAYKASDGIYFEVAKAKNYGALAHLDMDADTSLRPRRESADSESRVEGTLDKKSPRDFALWKFETADDYGNAYDASFGRGRPGWHIECSEMAREALGDTIDIHTGGVDLIFPHHTNEIAQSEAFNGKPFVKTWLHNEFVMVDGQKMSKSLGNHTTLKTITESGFSPLSFRYFVLGAHYRSKLNFTFEALEGAQNALKKLTEYIGDEVGSVNKDYQERFKDFITQDLDTPRALALLWEVAKDTSISPEDRTATLLDFDRVFGLGLTHLKTEPIPTHIRSLAHAREEARKNKDWEKSDKIREEIYALGYEILDTDRGSEIRKK